jgi:hypothetical protein
MPYLREAALSVLSLSWDSLIKEVCGRIDGQNRRKIFAACHGCGIGAELTRFLFSAQ